MDYMQISNELAQLKVEAEELIEQLPSAPAEQLGFDCRAFGSAFVGDGFIAIRKSADARAQYYGGLEYVDSYNRTEFGNYVLYYSSDPEDRIADHLRTFEQNDPNRTVA